MHWPAHHNIRPASRFLDSAGVWLIRCTHPCFRRGLIAAIAPVPLDEPPGPVLRRDIDIPDLVEQVSYMPPGTRPEQQVVSFRNDQSHFWQNRDCARNRLLDFPPEGWSINRFICLRAAQPSEKRYISRTVERIWRAFAGCPAKPLQLDICKVEPVHRHYHAGRANNPVERFGQRRFPGTRWAGQPENAPLAARQQGIKPLQPQFRYLVLQAAPAGFATTAAAIAKNLEQVAIKRIPIFYGML